ncbi:MAG: hypothetical protein ACOY45_13390 [Pseudomonadota bacterium]
MTGLFSVLFFAALFGVFKPYIKGLKRLHFGIAAFVALILVGITAPKPADVPQTASSSAEKPKTAPAPESSAAPREEPAPKSKWQYSQDKDEMRGTTARFASVDSENEVDLDFPYGEVRGTITLRQRPEDGLNVLFSVEKGQILCHSFTNTMVAVKFDNGPIQKFRCTSASDGSTETAFLSPASKALAALKKADRVIVEAEFFQQGRKQFTFDTHGLDWK